MLENYENICSVFFRQAELGNWKKLTIKDVSVQLKVEEHELLKLIPNKNHFLNFYNKNVDLEVINSLSEEELKISSKDEIIQEYFMQKLEIMDKYKFGFINILNLSFKDPAFLLINLKSNKDSVSKYLKKVSKNKNNISRVILTKLLLAIWLVAFNKWLYEENENESGLAIINKSIKRIKISTNLFSKI